MKLLLNIIICISIFTSCKKDDSSNSETSNNDEFKVGYTPATNSTISDTAAVVFKSNQSFDTSTLTLTGSMGTESDGGVWTTRTKNNDTLTVSPSSKWSLGSHTLTVSIKEKSNDSTPSPFTESLAYTVVAIPTPTVLSISTNSSQNIDVPIVIIFSESMDTATLIGSGSGWNDSDQGVWSTTTETNDTLTLKGSSSNTYGGNWSNSLILVYLLDAKSLNGISVTQINFNMTTNALLPQGASCINDTDCTSGTCDFSLCT